MVKWYRKDTLIVGATFAAVVLLFLSFWLVPQGIALVELPEAPHEHVDHGVIEVKPETAPSVGITVTEDAKSGWNVRIHTSQFQFSPEKVGMSHVEGEGHAHLYVDDVKVARLYGPWYHLELSPGDHSVRVTLNANSHEELQINGSTIQAATLVHEHGDTDKLRDMHDGHTH